MYYVAYICGGIQECYGPGTWDECEKRAIAIANSKFQDADVSTIDNGYISNPYQDGEEVVVFCIDPL